MAAQLPDQGLCIPGRCGVDLKGPLPGVGACASPPSREFGTLTNPEARPKRTARSPVVDPRRFPVEVMGFQTPKQGPDQRIRRTLFRCEYLALVRVTMPAERESHVWTHIGPRPKVSTLGPLVSHPPVRFGRGGGISIGTRRGSARWRRRRGSARRRWRRRLALVILPVQPSQAGVSGGVDLLRMGGRRFPMAVGMHLKDRPPVGLLHRQLIKRKRQPKSRRCLLYLSFRDQWNRPQCYLVAGIATLPENLQGARNRVKGRKASDARSIVDGTV